MTLIVAMTGAIDQYTELAAELGERFLRIRLKTPLDQVKLAKRSMDIAGEEDQIQRELHNSYREALMEARECLNEVSLSDATLNTLSCLAAVAARARTTVPSKLQPEPEATPRIMKQLTYLAQGQCALRGWRDTEDFSLLRRVAVDVIPEPRRGMLKDAGRKILKYGHVEISDLDYMSGSTQRRVMRDLDRLNVVDAEKGEADGRGRPPTRYSFEDEFRGWIDEASLYFSSRS